MQHRNNVNDNGYFSSKKNNDNVNDRDNGRKFDKARDVERIATMLVEKFGSSTWREFYCKVAYALPENIIWMHYETAVAKARTNPGGLFHSLCQRSMYDRSKNYNIAKG